MSGHLSRGRCGRLRAWVRGAEASREGRWVAGCRDGCGPVLEGSSVSVPKHLIFRMRGVFPPPALGTQEHTFVLASRHRGATRPHRSAAAPRSSRSTAQAHVAAAALRGSLAPLSVALLPLQIDNELRKSPQRRRSLHHAHLEKHDTPRGTACDQGRPACGQRGAQTLKRQQTNDNPIHPPPVPLNGPTPTVVQKRARRALLSVRTKPCRTPGWVGGCGESDTEAKEAPVDP